MDEALDNIQYRAISNKRTNDLTLSIIIPCYNDFQYIDEAVNSALSQTWPHKEVILIDDGSNEATKAKLRRLEPKLDLLINQENKGLSAARNKGIALAAGEFILVLDSDDYFEPEFSRKAIEEFQTNNHVKIVTCFTNWFNEESKEIFKPVGGQIKDALFMNPAMGSSMFRKSDWELVGGYDENMLKGYEDWEFYIRLLKQGGQVQVIPELLFNYRKNFSSMRIRANKVRYNIWEYIFLKHAELYKTYYEDYTKFLLNKLKKEESEKIKVYNRIDFQVGRFILAPLRFLKNQF